MLKTILSAFWMISGALLIISVLLHSPKGDGMGGLAASGGSLFTSARSAEATLNRVTWTLLALFLGLASPTSDSHGTAVASRIAEAAPGSRIFVASVFSELRDGEEVASVDAIARALDWLARNRIPVINMSLAGPPNPVLEAVTGRLVSRGHKLVAAVGNEGPNADAQYPAAYDGVVGVTAVDRRNQIYIYANQGDYVDFAAPGVDTTVAGPDGHTETVSGTSYAAPVIAVELARRLQRPDRVLAIRAENELAKSAKDLGEPGRDPVFGFGVIAPASE